MVSSVGLPVCVRAYNVLVSVSSVSFIAPCGKGNGYSGQQAAVTPFPPGSFPVPSTATAVQPVSDLCCVHTDTDLQRNTHINWQDMIAHVALACSNKTFWLHKKHLISLSISQMLKMAYVKIQAPAKLGQNDNIYKILSKPFSLIHNQVCIVS